MASVVQTVCPGCKKMLRFPSDWAKVALRCKNCGTVVHVRQKLSSPPLSRPSSGYGSSRALRAILIGGLLLVAAAAIGYVSSPRLGAPEPSREPRNETSPTEQASGFDHHSPKNILANGRVFPRRVLMISVNNYLYANPVGYGSPDRNLHALATRIAEALHVHPSQIVELCDRIPPRPSGGKQEKGKSDGKLLDWVVTARPPLKPIIEKTVNLFLESCRPQDHILVFFIGHMVEHGEEPYFVPLEGEPTNKETLIPLHWLYEQLTRCPAWQKVLIMDTCRFDPRRGQERPGSGPMSARIDELLQKPPPGVQVWSACSSGQYSYEFDRRGVFLDKLYEALKAPALKAVQNPEESLPMEDLARIVNPSTAAEVASQICLSDGQKAVQTPRLTGHMPEHEARHDEERPVPHKIEIPAVSLAPMATRAQVRGIVEEIDLPPLRAARGRQSSLHIEGLLPFSTQALERYRPDYRSLTQVEHEPAKYPLRIPVIQTVELLREAFDPDGPYGLLRDYFYGGSNERIKATIFKEQMKPARMLEELQERLEELRKAARHRDNESSPRWQAHYDYILAQLLARTAYVSEYNLMLGKIRKDELPELRPDVHSGWRLASCEKMQSGKEVREMAAESKKLFAKVIKEHPGTPWEVLAKRAQRMNLGLEWEPSR